MRRVFVALVCGAAALGCASSMVDGTGGSAGDPTGGPTGGSGGTTCSDELCDGVDNDCDGKTDEDCDCIDGDEQECFTGDRSLATIGTCAFGVQTCDETGTWGGCLGEVLPESETCDGADNDCNGAIDEGFGMVSCGLGVCVVTVEECIDGVPNPCTPLPGSPVEACDGIDDDCDGTIDEDCLCNDEEVQSCYSGDPATLGVGVCIAGQQTCVGGMWGPCIGEVVPTTEICNGLDDDCDVATIDGSAEPMLNLPCDGPDGDNCLEGTFSCSAGMLSCDDNTGTTDELCAADNVDEDCDGTIDEGFPRDSNPACIGGQFFIASVAGDTGSQNATHTGHGEEWVRMTVREDSSSSIYLSARIELTSAAGTDFDLFVYCDQCGGSSAGSSTAGGLTGHTDTVNVRANDTPIVDDEFDVLIEIRHFNTNMCAEWSLFVQGNTVANNVTCN